MGKFCLVSVPESYVRRLFGCALLVTLAGLPAHAASNHARAVLHIEVTVVPTVQASTAQLSATTPTGSVTYNLQPPTASKMTSQVTVQPISTQNANRSGQSTKGGMLQTTTFIIE